MSGSTPSLPQISLPNITVSLSLNPPFHPQTTNASDPEQTVPELTITATLDSSAPSPITIFTWSTIFNPELGLKRRAFSAHNLSRSPPSPIPLEITKGPKRPAFQRRKGSADEKYYLTLRPGTPTFVRCPFSIVRRTIKEGEEDVPTFPSGQKYALAVSEEWRKVQTWWWGTAEEILDEADGPAKDVSGLEGQSIIVLNEAVVEFTIEG